jgi:regulator of RNase E activity RraA
MVALKIIERQTVRADRAKGLRIEDMLWEYDFIIVSECYLPRRKNCQPLSLSTSGSPVTLVFHASLKLQANTPIRSRYLTLLKLVLGKFNPKSTAFRASGQARMTAPPVSQSGCFPRNNNSKVVSIQAEELLRNHSIRKSGNSLRARAFGMVVLVAVLAGAALIGTARPRQESSGVKSATELLDGFRHVECASVSDAIEQLTGEKMYMSHRMRPIFPAKFAGFALTVKLKKEANDDPNSLQGMLAAIDAGDRDSVYVMSVEDGVDIAGMGGLMGSAMHARNFSGAVIDGGVRDVAYLNKIGFPVYSLGIVPSTSVHHYRFAGSNIPLLCDGVEVNPRDIIVADADGVVVVPLAKAPEVLALAQTLDFNEHSMYAYIEKLKSITEAVKKFGRL